MTGNPAPYRRPVRAVGGTLLAVTLAAVAIGDDRSDRPRVEAVVPVPPTEHERVYYFGRRYHHLVPGTVTIDRPPYVCDLDGRTFGDEDDFVAHLRTAHRALPEAIPDQLVVHHDGRVHFIGK